MKKVGIMQPYFFPYLGYWQLIASVDQFIVYDDVNYINRGWINRNHFLINGEKKLFTILLEKASQNKLINEIWIKDDFSKFIKMLHLNYSKAPFFKDVIAMVESICSFQNKNLALFLYNSIVQVVNYLGMETDLLLSSSLQKDNARRGQEKILHICELLDADMYINAIGGKELYDADVFGKHHLELRFLQTGEYSYKQTGNDFVSQLSILDVLMFNSKEKVGMLLNEYTLI